MAIINNDVAEYFGVLNKKLSVLQESIAADRSIPGGERAATKPRRPRRQKIPPPPFLSVRQLAEIGSVSIKTVYWWLAAQKIPASTVRKWRGLMVLHQDDAARFLTGVEPLQTVVSDTIEAEGRRDV
jgi:hypothetical protein